MPDRELLAQARGHAYELMLGGQYLMDRATTDTERLTADCVYHAGWAVYNMTNILLKKGKNNGQ